MVFFDDTKTCDEQTTQPMVAIPTTVFPAPSYIIIREDGATATELDARQAMPLEDQVAMLPIKKHVRCGGIGHGIRN